MTKRKRTPFKFSEESLHKIDVLLPRLKYSVMPSKIVRWLENFDEVDLPMIYDFLQVFEYITFTEMQYRLEDLLTSIFSELNDKDKAIVIPYGKFGKSGTLVSYPLTHAPFYQEMKKLGRITITNDCEKYKIEDFDCVILLDDFIGSGKTFCDEYVDEGIEKWIKSSVSPTKVIVLATVIMAEGKAKIESTFRYIEVYAQERNRLFDIANSPLSVLGKVSDYRDLNDKYENLIPVYKTYKKGFGGSESLIAFTHGTPNNTIPIIWYGGDWETLFPRHAKTRMDEARGFKKEIAFYIGICNRLGVDLLDLNKEIFVRKKDGYERKREYNSQIFHSLIALIKLKEDNREDYIISHTLGLTDFELEEVYKLAIEKRFVDSSRGLTVKGRMYLKKLEQKVSKEKFRAPTENNLEMKDINYVPLSFKGLT